MEENEATSAAMMMIIMPFDATNQKDNTNKTIQVGCYVDINDIGTI